jgi:hypothetical protein
MNQRIKDSVSAVLWSLPYELRRRVYRTLQPRAFRRYQQMREASTEGPHSLRAFDEHGCLFVHIPKCAGVSVGKALFGYTPGSHISALTFQLIYPREDYERFFKFAFVRNPWERLSSAFHFLKSGGMTPKDRRWAESHLAPFPDLDAFVRGWVTPSSVLSGRHLKPQHRYICDPRGNVQVDFVARFENLHEDFSTIAQRIGSVARLGHLNRTPGKKRDYRDDYSAETRRIVAEVYRRDIEVFGYEFG